MTMDSIAGIYFPLIMAKPVLFFFFAPILWLMGVALMNLVAQQHIHWLDQGFLWLIRRVHGIVFFDFPSCGI